MCIYITGGQKLNKSSYQKTSRRIIYKINLDAQDKMLRREQSKLKSALRRQGGAGVTPYGGGIYQYGAGIYQYGAGITSYGGLRRMGGSAIGDFFKKGVKKVKGYFQKEGPSIAKSLASKAASAATDYAQGKSIKDIGKSLGSQALDKATSTAMSRVPDALKPFAETGIKTARAKTGLGMRGGTAPLRPAKGELSSSQLKYLKQRADRRPNDAAPVFDRHELQMFGNIIQGKQIIGSGMKM